MNIDELRHLCLSFPGATEQVQWGNDLVFKAGGKIFAVTPLEPAKLWISLKADPEDFHELTERSGVIPAPYLARAKWIAIESPDAIPRNEVTALLRKSYDLVVEKLPRKIRESLASAKSKDSAKPRKSSKRKRPRKN
jgi:predicted DNA-binding protein (MmcQ/YjbR family)